MNNEPELVRACSESIQNQGLLNYLMFAVKMEKQERKVNAKKFHIPTMSGLYVSHIQSTFYGRTKNDKH